MTSRFSLAAFGLPGKFTIRVLPRIPEIARESIAWGGFLILADRIASERPGASRSLIAFVAIRETRPTRRQYKIDVL